MDMPLRTVCGELDLDSVIATPELSRRPFRPPNHEAENRALVALAQEMASSPDGVLQRLVDWALDLCAAHSAGITLTEQGEDGQPVLRWHAVAGRFASLLGNLMPRDFSPCGVVLNENAPQLFLRPERHYPYLLQVDPPVVEGLLLPFAVAGEPVGTIWVLTHDESHTFDAEDLRVLQSLAKLAGVAYQMVFSVKALEEADRRKDEFLAVLAHELRNPLTPIRSAVQILRREETPEADLRSARETIDRQVCQMTHLIDDLLDVSRISHGRIELRRERVELAEVVRSALETSRPLVESSGHRLDVELPPGPIPLEGDPTRLAQVFSNLLNNAAKYTERGGQIRLTAEQVDHHVRVRVTDSGIGISPAQLPKLFKMFTQGANSLERAQGGLGIGLGLARSLAEMHGGTVEASSAGLGQGSEFVVRLPVAVEAPRTAEPSPAASGAARAGATAQRVLVVDDNQDAADSLSALLQLMGHEVRTAYDGVEAVAAAASFAPSVVLLDIGLPRMNGYEVARRIREQPRGQDMTLIAVTGWGQDEDKRRSREAGFDLHITKPLDPAILDQLLVPVAH
jgi:signal transduction histidine kinase/CheY-like chemotaxis protein